jgi:hypothetical protein
VDGCAKDRGVAPSRGGRKSAIRFLNQGYHNIGFDRGMDLRVASRHQAILALVEFLSSKVENRERCTQVPSGALFGALRFLKKGGWSAEISTTARIQG